MEALYWLCISIYLNISFSRTINKLVKNVQLQEVNDYPFLQKIIEVSNYQYLFEGRNVELKDISINKPYLCIVYLSSMCGSCVDESILDISKLEDSIHKQNLLIITDYTQKRDKQILQNKIGKDIVLLDLSDVKFDKEIRGFMNVNNPLLFIIDKDKRMKSMLLHIKEIPAYNQAYYKAIKDLYFK